MQIMRVLQQSRHYVVAQAKPNKSNQKTNQQPKALSFTLPSPSNSKALGVIAVSTAIVSLGALLVNKIRTEQELESGLPRSTSSKLFPFSSRRTIEQELNFIEAKRIREIKREQQLWDQRFSLREKSVVQLREIARKRGVRATSKLRKQELIAAIEAAQGLIV